MDGGDGERRQRGLKSALEQQGEEEKGRKPLAKGKAFLRTVTDGAPPCLFTHPAGLRLVLESEGELDLSF